MATTFVNMRRWSDAKLEKELAFATPSPLDGDMEREWGDAVRAEYARRQSVSA